MLASRDMTTRTCCSLEDRTQPEKSTAVHLLLALHLLYTFTTELLKINTNYLGME